MIGKFKNYFKKIDSNQQQLLQEIDAIKKQNSENEWANVYHDSIRGKKYLEELPLNIGRWAGNYSFFYVLNRILNDFKPQSILELGLGESSKFISTYIDNELIDTAHLIVEQDEGWVNAFENKFNLSGKSKILHLPLELKIINKFEVNTYKDFEEKVKDNFDLYLVDGPFGSNRYSRYDIVHLVNQFTQDQEFIILFDDTERVGEFETCNDIEAILKTKNIEFHSRKYEGVKASTVIATKKYQYATSF